MHFGLAVTVQKLVHDASGRFASFARFSISLLRLTSPRVHEMARRQKHVHLKGDYCIGAATFLSYDPFLARLQLYTLTVRNGLLDL